MFHRMGLETKIRPVTAELPEEDFPVEDEDDQSSFVPQEPGAPDNMLDEVLKDRQNNISLLKEGEGSGRLIGSDLHEITLDTENYGPYERAEVCEKILESFSSILKRC